MVDFSRLSANWVAWIGRLGIPDLSVSTTCDDCEVFFKSKDHSVHLSNDGSWWVVDTVDDRGQRSNADARLSTFDLAEKYLIWRWLTFARSSLASGPLGADLYKRGYAPGIDVSQLNDAYVRICLSGECAILIVGTATIFSHLMAMSVTDLDKMANEF